MADETKISHRAAYGPKRHRRGKFCRYGIFFDMNKSVLRNVAEKLGLYTFLRPVYHAIRHPRSTWSDYQQNRKRFNFYSQLIAANDLCFDVGANNGNRVEIFLRLGAKVVAVEPQPECVRTLQEKFGQHHNFVLIASALGAHPGEADLFVSDANTISSMSRDWVESVRLSGRFAEHTWDTTIRTPVTTLDSLIEQYGVPTFCKIDVEGFEYEVLKGLSHPISILSFEFTPEYLDAAHHCIEHLAELGLVTFNCSLAESMVFHLERWVSSLEIEEILSRLPDDCFGDVYARFGG